MLDRYLTLTADLTRDDAGAVSAAQLLDAVEVAVLRYSKDRPRQVIDEITAPGGTVLPLPSGWVTDFSLLQAIEYPVSALVPNFLGKDAYAMRNTPDGQQIISSQDFAIDDRVWLHITVPHMLTASRSTIPEGDREAVCCLAAASLCEQLASLYAGDTNSTIMADSVEHQEKSTLFAARAKSLRQRYMNELGVDPKRAAPAGTVISLPSKDSRGRPRLTH